jgi:hypothetical protein
VPTDKRAWLLSPIKFRDRTCVQKISIKAIIYGIHENWGPEGWFVNKELADGGALANMGVHAIETKDSC